MALFLEDSQKVTQKKIPIPQNAKKVFKAMEKVYEPYLDKAEGGHVLKSLASDKHYNKKGNNAENNGKKKKIDTVSVDDAKVRLHRMDKFSPNSIQYQMYGGELGKNIYKDGIQQARSVTTVDAVKPPKPTSNAEVKPAVVKTKEVSTPNGKISYTVTAENRKHKKVYISEAAIKKIYEDYRQLKLPFNDTTGKGYDDKYNYEHFIDWLEYVGEYGTLENSGISKRELWGLVEDYSKEAFNVFSDDCEDAYYLDDISYGVNALFNYGEDCRKEYFYLPEELYEDPNFDILNYIDETGIDIEDLDSVEKILTDKGCKELNKIMFENFKSRYEDNGIPYNLAMNERGLIYIEREISVPETLSTKISVNNEELNKENYFEFLRKLYNGIGNCWSWNEGHGEAYCAGHYDRADYILLQGWVNPRNVNWAETLARNSWSLNGEDELYINSGAIVEIDKIVLNNASSNNLGKNILPEPMLIKV